MNRKNYCKIRKKYINNKLGDTNQRKTPIRKDYMSNLFLESSIQILNKIIKRSVLCMVVIKLPKESVWRMYSSPLIYINMHVNL